MIDTFYLIVLLLNALWFAAGFRFFWLKAKTAAKVLVAQENRSSVLFETITASGVFLGGMNLAFSVMSILIIIFIDSFSTPTQISVLGAVFCVAHLSQFLGNLPIALKEYQGTAPIWPVLSGPMLFLFVVDGLLASLNFILILLAH